MRVLEAEEKVWAQQTADKLNPFMKGVFDGIKEEEE